MKGRLIDIATINQYHIVADLIVLSNYYEGREMKFSKWLKLSWIPIVIGILLFPTVSLGGTYASSLVGGKSPQEAAVILADQINVLFGRVDKLEEFQEQQENINDLQSQINDQQSSTNDESQQTVESLNATIATLNSTIAAQKATISSLQTTQEAQSEVQDSQAKQIECDQLKQTTMQFGNVALINNDVVAWYEDIMANEASWLENKTAEEMAEAKALYDNYIAKCQ